jgi:hypothetical protein
MIFVRCLVKQAPDSTFSVSRYPCKPGLYCGLFHLPNWTLILTGDLSVYLIEHADFESCLFRLPNFDILTLITEFCN